MRFRPIDPLDIYESLRTIRDPEYLYKTLEDLAVVKEEYVIVDPDTGHITVLFHPTTPYCSMVLYIGLSIFQRMLNDFGPNHQLTVTIFKGSHLKEDEYNKQLADKERRVAGMENEYIMRIINKCLQEYASE